MFKIGDKVKFISVDKLDENFEKYGSFVNQGDMLRQEELQGIVDTIVGFDRENNHYVYLKNTKISIDYYFIGRLEKVNKIDLPDNLFEL